MPFKSEKQRRYLWANEPEIARDWTDTYGSRIQKKNGGITQAGAINYEPSDMVSVPKEFRARAHSPNTHLAYITDDEAGILQALKPDTPHKGPEGIPNYDSFDISGGYTSGRDIDDSTGQARNSNQRFSGGNEQQDQEGIWQGLEEPVARRRMVQRKTEIQQYAIGEWHPLQACTGRASPVRLGNSQSLHLP